MVNELLVSKQTNDLRKHYNHVISDIIVQLKELQLSEEDINVEKMTAVKENFSKLTSASNRRKVELAFAAVYDNYTLDVERMARKVSQTCEE